MNITLSKIIICRADHRIVLSDTIPLPEPRREFSSSVAHIFQTCGREEVSIETIERMESVDTRNKARKIIDPTENIS